MAFLVRCPCCRRPKRVGEHAMRPAVEGDPEAWCIACRILFVAWVDSNGVAHALELPPFSR